MLYMLAAQNYLSHSHCIPFQLRIALQDCLCHDQTDPAQLPTAARLSSRLLHPTILHHLISLM
jgi:hypothetical protein